MALQEAMAVYLPSLRNFIRPVLCALFVAGEVAGISGALASHERPWTIAPVPARIVQHVPLPAGGDWIQAVALGDGTAVLLRPYETGNGPFLAKLPPAAQQVENLVLHWPDRASAGRLVMPVSLAVDETGQLWLLDQGDASTPSRLLKIDPANGTVLSDRSLPAGAATPRSRFTALAVRGTHAYLADEGGTALTVIDLGNQTATRFFAGYPAVRGHSPLVIDHRTVTDKAGQPMTRDIAMLTLQPDGKWLYEQTPAGPLYRLSTDLLTDPAVTPSELMEGVTEWRGTPTLGGLTAGPDSTLYMTDLTNGRLLGFDTGRHPLILLTDPALVHAGAPAWTRGTGGTPQILIPAGHDLLRVALP